jgi:hypothetical protein
VQKEPGQWVCDGASGAPAPFTTVAWRLFHSRGQCWVDLAAGCRTASLLALEVLPAFRAQRMTLRVSLVSSYELWRTGLCGSRRRKTRLSTWRTTFSVPDSDDSGAGFGSARLRRAASITEQRSHSFAISPRMATRRTALRRLVGILRPTTVAKRQLRHGSDAIVNTPVKATGRPSAAHLRYEHGKRPRTGSTRRVSGASGRG